MPAPIATDSHLIGLPALRVSHKRTNRQLMAVAHLRQAEQIGNLTEGDEQTRPGHEAENDRLGNVARQVAQAQQGDD